MAEFLSISNFCLISSWLNFHVCIIYLISIYRKVTSSRPVYYSIFDHFGGATKDQLISKELFAILDSSKKTNETIRS